MNSASESVAIGLQHISKNYGDVTALTDVSLSIRDQEFFTLLGPSGCGKTTLLRIIAGFEQVSAGNIQLYGEEIRDLPANKRPVNTVFQQYSLFPHMTVAENVGFGLQMQGRERQYIKDRTRQMLELVQLESLADRKSPQLSGGQQQRVALARALAPEPKVLLLDEPLSALDLKLRQSMRMELKQIQQETGITFVFVTHDQEEALTMSDRIAVMSDGRIQQVGDAKTIYRNPCNLFVSDFIGETNKLDAVLVQQSDSGGVCELADGTSMNCGYADAPQGAHGQLCIRPEQLTVTSTGDPNADLHGVVKRFVFLGTDTQITVALPFGAEVLVRVQNTSENELSVQLNESVGLILDQGSARFLDN